MDRFAIFVDAGYFYAAGAQAAFGRRTPQISRKQLSIKSPPAMMEALFNKAGGICKGVSSLRAYWYDAMPGPRMSLEQNAIAMLPGVKVRLGALNSAGEQKGVDSLIVTDVIDLARNRAISDAVVVSGDEDLRIAVQIAQSYGVRVHILAAGDPAHNVSPSLQMEADSVESLDGDWFGNYFDLSAPAAMSAPAAIPAAEPAAVFSGKVAASADATPPIRIETLADGVIAEMIADIKPDQRKQLAAHFSIHTTVPPEYDRPLIAKVSAALSGRRLTGEERRCIRGQFISATRGTGIEQ
ncbi:uncharacterized protein E1O_01510 [Burkholderiales bacterium GJ-E10]|nr:uncharacterized protein E1O_01510 [Burkholderiales bacterium GJ-E10]